MEDEQILTLFKEEKTKEQAFRALMEKYQHTVYYTVRHYVFLHEDADDITQNVFIKVWRYLENFRGESSLKTWITRISINESLTFLEKKKKTLNLSDDQYTDHLLNVAAEERHFSADNIEQLLQKAIIKLPEKQRLVFTLRYYEEMPYEEMSKALGTSVGALKASYHFAMQKVEADLKEAVK
ncbi:MAG: sigma-70 family RNA polymerase sigma factor [Bacteroidales bacterium]|nr:sigma-70 family RNA polymerase sigma factor [Bacteroidales bacterium]